MSNRSIRVQIIPELVKLIVVDSLCGFGGYTEGCEQVVDGHGNRLVVVICGVNHDPDALYNHSLNHPETRHFREDIRSQFMWQELVAEVAAARLRYPNAKLVFHCSLECTNLSNAKGGKSRDADSRSLAEYMPDYLRWLDPDIFTVENVREFMANGPVEPKVGKSEQGYPCCPIVYIEETVTCNQYGEHFIQKREILPWKKGKSAKRIKYHDPVVEVRQQIYAFMVPVSRDLGQDYVKWHRQIEDMGYRYSHRLDNTANFGANTSRTRYFAQFVKPGIDICWPQATHAKNPDASPMLGEPLKKWRPIRECLELNDKGKSIFRETPLSPKTYERIFEGLVRHVGNGSRQFIAKYFTGTGMNSSLDDPESTVKTKDSQAIVSTEFMARLFATASNNHGTYSPDQPASTITTADGHAVVSALVMPSQFCLKYHSTGHNTFSTDEPCSTLQTHDSVAVIDSQFVSLYYSSGKQSDGIGDPASALTTIPKHRLVSARFIDQQYGNSLPASIDEPCGTITANPKLAVVEAFVVDPQWGGHSHSIDKPSHTIIARQDKAPSSLVSPSWLLTNMHHNTGSSMDDPGPTLLTGNHHYLMSVESLQWAYLQFDNGYLCPVILVYESDIPIIRKIKAFMAEYGIFDILMRMLKVRELKLIQGFRPNYITKGSDTSIKKFLGNSIPPPYIKAWISAIVNGLN